MSDSDFPSGPWTGFFSYSRLPGKWRTDVQFTFERGRITGEGNDSVGPFIIAGGYNAGTKECYWTKTYVAAHDVFYKGFREGKGIWERGRYSRQRGAAFASGRWGRRCGK